MLPNAGESWTTVDSSELYEVARWGHGYFSVGDNGHVQVHPDKNPARSIDLKLLVDRLEMRGLDLPILIRFNGILQDRLREINRAFTSAIKDGGYQGRYTCVFPIKVNQQRQVVEQIVKYGSEFGFGLEAGSKPELFAVVAMTTADMPIICNGFKDAEFIEMAMLAQKLGRRVIPVVEKYTELELILRYAEIVGVRPQIGMRMKLAARGSGRWQASGGHRSKFGLTTNEILRALNELERRGMADCFKLLHFHLGSQVTNIRHVKNALNEVTRVYVDLAKRGAGLQFLNVGGGLGVDYDGSQTNFESSVNYTLQEYANDVVHHIQTICDEAGVAHPNIISESGRAVVAYHSALVFSVVGVSGLGNELGPITKVPPEAEQPLHDLYETLTSLTARNVLESYHDAQQAMEMVMSLFKTGYLPLEQRGLAENLFWSICRQIHQRMADVDFVPDELAHLDHMLSDTYFCNFSLFQSMPDSWAIKQLFPIMPIHRLHEQPTQHAVLCDITCDSDGKIEQFIDRRDVKQTIKLHRYNDQSYYLAAFLIGAYQEILGDLHNLFGDTNAVHVELDEQGKVVLKSIIKGDTVSEVLDYVEFNRLELVERLESAVEDAVQSGKLDHEQAGRLVKFYQEALDGYTYLEEPPKYAGYLPPTAAFAGNGNGSAATHSSAGPAGITPVASGVPPMTSR